MKPRVIERRGCKVNLEAGSHAWCACGRSRNQPYCDGSHEGTGIEPVIFVVDEACRMNLCMCKRSEHAPRCDGCHNRIPSSEVDGPMPPLEAAGGDAAAGDEPGDVGGA